MDTQEPSGNNVMSAEDRNAQLAALKADVEQTQAQLAQAAQDPTPQAIANTETQVQSQSTPVSEAKAPDANKDAQQQQKNKSGEMSEEKIQENIEHLRKGTEEKERILKMTSEERREYLLKLHKESQKKFTQISQQAAEALKNEARNIASETPRPLNAEVDDISPDFNRDVYSRIESNPGENLVKEMFRVARAVARQELDRKVSPLMSEWEEEKMRSVDQKRARELDDLYASGHEWILQPGGIDRIEAFLNDPQNAWIRNSPTPYKAAVRFMDDIPSANGTASHSAQVGPKTPILSASGAVPPPSSVPAVSLESQVAAINAEIEREWSSRRPNMARIRELTEKQGSLLGAR